MKLCWLGIHKWTAWSFLTPRYDIRNCRHCQCYGIRVKQPDCPKKTSLDVFAKMIVVG